jgi:putative membrane protein
MASRVVTTLERVRGQSLCRFSQVSLNGKSVKVTENREVPMHRTFVTGFTLMIGLLFLVLAAAPASWAILDPAGMKKTFIEKAAQGQQAEIALGQLAMQKASNEQVKQFGQRMIADHQKANREVQQLAQQEGISVPMQLSDKQKQKQQELSRLSGNDFDRSYIGYMLHDHVKDVHEFKESAEMVQDPQVKQWATGTLPILEEHLKQAQSVASAIGVSASQ